jgi:SAM-dependent methyltransferase
MLSTRARGAELLDHPNAAPDEAAASYRFMRMVNRFFGGERPVRRFLAERWATSSRTAPLRVLDVGSGDCSLPVRLNGWCRRRGIEAQFTCVDACDHAAAATAGVLAAADDDRVRFLHADVFELPGGVRYDCAVASMFLHHFDDEIIPRVVAAVLSVTDGPLLVNDLQRSALNLAGARLLSCGWHETVRQDAVQSVRRGFQPGELFRLLEPVPGLRLQVEGMMPGRIYAVVHKSRQ